MAVSIAAGRALSRWLCSDIAERGGLVNGRVQRAVSVDSGAGGWHVGRIYRRLADA